MTKIVANSINIMTKGRIRIDGNSAIDGDGDSVIDGDSLILKYDAELKFSLTGTLEYNC